MIRLITLLATMIFAWLSAQNQYQTGMQQALKLWGENKPQEASAMLERIASLEKNEWLPNYYISIINTTQAFQAGNDKEKIEKLLERAQIAHDDAKLIAKDEVELLVVQAMIKTGWIMYDPMTNGMTLSAEVNKIYAQAMKKAPNNPRVVFQQANFEMGSAKYFGSSIQPMCESIKKSIELFETFKPETALHPSWGKSFAEQTYKACNQ
jgi:hypothetical protein